MRKRALFLFLFLVLAGCSSESTTQSEPTFNSEKEQTAITTNESTEKSTAEQNKQVKNEEAFDWSGEWVFLSDDNLGTLRIEQEDDHTIRYHLGGSSISAVNHSSYGNLLEGKGTIQDDTILFTNDLQKECGGTMVRDGSRITVTVKDENCHTSRVHLDGEYKKLDHIKKQPLFNMKDGKMVVWGIFLGDNPSAVKSLHGNPDYEGPDEDGFYEWIQDYKRKELFVSYSSNQTVSIHGVAPKKLFLKAAEVKLSGERYRSEDGANYIYVPETEELLIYRTDSENPSTITFFMTYADGNFHAGVEGGWIIPVK
ncbi:hypothetical protein [Metabacillus iocasae]|uniref:Lipocalin-like domain-containing protein n=1 Tax=Priestia iocasae TaxID=2291674 RepID=A0ABS2QZ53_9BACI|nr:hypothetical protein [Metabacillus iocasae]MBM7703996.1 hypothetical protein [Metabacillus iocasae]